MAWCQTAANLFPEQMKTKFTIEICMMLWISNGLFYLYPSGLLLWHLGNMIAQVPVK